LLGTVREALAQALKSLEALAARQRDAALGHRSAQILRGADHGDHLRRGQLRVHSGHGARTAGRRLGVRRVRQLHLAVLGSCGVGLGAVAIACTFRPPLQLPAALPSPSVAHWEDQVSPASSLGIQRASGLRVLPADRQRPT
jgi:hypothetical protein